jgi:probable HAF family extracellular repeat protein
VVGRSNTTNNNSIQAVIWNGTTPTVLSGLGGTYSEALGINASGQVVGVSRSTGNSSDQAVIWNGTTPTVLGGLGGTFSAASGINASGQVVGYSRPTGNADIRAVVWNGTTVPDLNTALFAIGAGWTLRNASGINDNGQIVGTAINSITGLQSAFLLTPVAAVPLPAAAWLMLSGIGALVVAARRRKAA